MKFPIAASLTACLVLFAISCSASTQPPTAPDLTPQCSNPAPSSKILWDLWDVFIDESDRSVEAVPLRGAQFTCNVTKFVDGPPSTLTFGTVEITPGGGYKDVDLGIYIEHPFPDNPVLAGFDVLGVVMGNGTTLYPGTTDFYVPGPDDLQLLDADGYTRWFNYPEFSNTTGNLFSYTPGTAGSPGYTPSSRLNGYLYFTDNLFNDDVLSYLSNNPDQRGKFTAQSLPYPPYHGRYYSLRFPDAQGLKFQYAVLANWANPHVPNPALSDFPPDANSQEAPVIEIDDTSWLFKQSEYIFGGNVNLTLHVWDWSAEPVSGVIEEYSIRMVSECWDNPVAVDMVPLTSEPCYNIFTVTAPVDHLPDTDNLRVWIEISYPAYDYTNDFGIPNNADGPLTSYALANIPIEFTNGWVRSMGSVSDDCAMNVMINEDGEIYVTGYSSGQGTRDIFVAKYNKYGVQVWSRIWGGTSEDEGACVASNDSETIYIAGHFSDTVDFNPWGEPDIHTAAGCTDSFLANFTVDGEFEWVRTWGGPGEDRCNSLNFNYYNRVAVVGEFTGAADFDPTESDLILTSNGEYDAFYTQYKGGVFKNACSWGGPLSDRALDVSFSCWDYFLVTGEFRGSVEFNPSGGDLVSSNGDSDAFLAYFEGANYHNVITWGGPGTDWANGIVGAVDWMVVTGGFSDTVDFASDGSFVRTSNGLTDAYVLALWHENQVQWVNTWGGPGYDFGTDVAIKDYVGHYVTGGFSDSADFYPGANEDIHDSHGDLDAFLCRFTADNYAWSRTWGGTGPDFGYSISTDNDGIYVTGGFNNTVDFAPTSDPCNADPDVRTSQGSRDIYLGKWLADGCW